jgi:DNA-binding protein YbaB
MAKMIGMMKQMKQVRRMQKKLAAKTVEATSSDKSVTVEARGDMTLKAIRIDAEALKNMKPERLERTIVSTVNSALDSAKKAAAGDMSKMGDLGGLSGMLGG